MSAASGIGYNPDNMWLDLKTLQRARKDGAKFLLCLDHGKLATSLVGRDTRKAKKSWGAWVGSGVSSVTRTVGGLVYDNNRLHIAQYLERLTENVEERSEELFIKNQESWG